MNFNDIGKVITKNDILSAISQESIFSHYFKISESIIDHSVINKASIISPVAADENPSAGFYYAKGTLRMRDFRGYFHGDCFDAAGFALLLNANDPREFNLILHDIANVFGLIRTKDNITVKKPVFFETKDTSLVKIKLNVEIMDRWTSFHLDYMRKYGINKELLDKAKVFPIKSYTINNNIHITHENNNPIFGYYLGEKNNESVWIIYIPYNKKIYGNKATKFITNGNKPQGIWLLDQPNYPFGVITKSLKDVLVLYVYGIPSIAPHSESVMFNKKEMDYINKKFSGNVFTLFDFDKAGITLTNKMKRAYKTKPLFLFTGRFSKIYGLPNLYKKDISDFREFFGHNPTKELINACKSQNKTVFLTWHERFLLHTKQIEWL